MDYEEHKLTVIAEESTRSVTGFLLARPGADPDLTYTDPEGTEIPSGMTVSGRRGRDYGNRNPNLHQTEAPNLHQTEAPNLRFRPITVRVPVSVASGFRTPGQEPKKPKYDHFCFLPWIPWLLEKYRHPA
jgi:hypothetical protein